MLTLLKQLVEVVGGWPLILYVIVIGIIYTIALRFIQLRRFAYAWRLTLFPPKTAGTVGEGGITPIRAFVNALSTSVGNGSLAGMATAVHTGGPGAALWVVVFGVVLMAVRFVEVYVSVWLSKSSSGKDRTLGGPMLYLQEVPAGKYLAYIYAACCFAMGLTLAAAMQSNSIALSANATWGISRQLIAVLIGSFVLYVLLGGGERVSRVTAKLVPLNLAAFCIASISLLIYHVSSLPGALALIWHSAFNPMAPIGALAGFSVVQAVRLGMARSIMATESGLGSAAIMFGFMKDTNALKNGLMSMLTTLISTCVCFVVALCIVVSGVWKTAPSLDSTALTGAAFETVFCRFGSMLVTLLSLGFGISVMAGYTYIGRMTWLFLTHGQWIPVFVVLYAGSAIIGSVADASIVWSVADVPIIGMLFVNLFGLLYLLPRIVRNVQKDEKALSA